MRRLLRSSLVIFYLFATAALSAATVIQFKPDKEAGIYEAGQTVTWSISIENDQKPASGKCNYVLKLGGAEELSKGELNLADGKASVTGTRPDAGCLLLEVHYKAADAAQETIGRGGAAFSPDKIAISTPPPADFDAFWEEQIKKLHAVPMNAQLTKVDVGDPSIEYFKITLDNVNGTKIQGQIAKPAGKNTDLPAMLQVQWAGVYKLDPAWVKNFAKQGWLSMNIEAHDLPIDESAEFYKTQSEGPLKDYPGIGNDNRDTAYFLRMFLSAYRGIDYLLERPEWNKKTMLVQGGSQGGYQTLVIAGLHPAITAYAANVPAGCDHTGKLAKRAPGWPNWAGRAGKDREKMLEASRYFDCMNFAPHIKAPGIIGMGLIDTTCPPEGVFATLNTIKPEKKVILMPLSDHKGSHDAYYKVFGPFIEEQRKK